MIDERKFCVWATVSGNGNLLMVSLAGWLLLSLGTEGTISCLRLKDYLELPSKQ